MPRDGVGNFTLAPGNPVVPGTVIEAAWANPTLSDIAGALTDSLSRSGAGGMLVPFRNIDGTVGAPGMTWVNEPSSGWYRAGLNDFWYSVGNENIFRITKTSVEVAPGKNFIGGGAFTMTKLTVASGSLVASNPGITLTQTWNNAAIVFIGADTNITDTASQLGSIIERWQVNAVSMMVLSKTGGLFLPVQGGAGGVIIGIDTQLYRSAADVLRTPDAFAVDGYLLVKGVNPGVNTPLVGVIDYGNAAGMRLFSYGPDAVTRGIFTLSALRSDGSASFPILTTSTAGDMNISSNWTTFSGNSAGTNPVGMTSGFAIGWNKSSADGEVDFYCHKDGGTVGGFQFWDWTGAVATKTFTINAVAGVGNYLSIFSAPLGGNVGLRLQGASADIGMDHITKGTGAHFFYTNNAAGIQMVVSGTNPGANRYILVTGSFNGNPSISTSAGELLLNSPAGFIHAQVQVAHFNGVNAPGASTYGATGYDATYGQQMIGNGTTADCSLFNRGGSPAFWVTGGTTNCVVNGNLSKGSGSFDIVHPLDANKRLRHSFIEGPRYDLIYRGNATVVGGTAVVNIDTGSGGGGMAAGTFVALTRNPSAWLNRGNCTFTLVGPTLTITGPDGPVSWLVIAERNDAYITSGGGGWSDVSGNMILEYTPTPEEIQVRSGSRRAPPPITPVTF